MALRIIYVSVVQILLFAVTVWGPPSFTPVLPPAYPLSVRNPYLSAWLPGNQTADLPYAVPQFWNGLELTWSVMARVNNEAYSLFGVPDPVSGVEAGSLRSAKYTSIHTVFELDAGSASFTLVFLSPISPHDYIRQSLLFSYLTISASAANGNSASIQIYSDIDNSWIGQFGAFVQTRWGYATTTSGAKVFVLGANGAEAYLEVDEMAQWGTAVYCTQSALASVSAQVGDASEVRKDWVANGHLSTDWPWEPEGTKNVTFAIGLVREEAVHYLDQDRTNYWHSALGDINSACAHALEDFPAADAESRTLDAEIEDRAASIAGANYSDIVTLSARQAFGAIDLAIPLDTLDQNDVMAFVKEISSNGSVDTVDVIFPLSPILYVLAPEYIRLLLEPIMRYLASGAWPHDWTIHDIGTHYPNATGHDDGDAEQMPIEECGNMILLAYMYQTASGNDGWVDLYSSLFQQYIDYLVNNGLHPPAELSSDDAAGPVANQTGLAVKAAIALNAYGKMTSQTRYSDIGRQFADNLYAQASGTDPDRIHSTLTQNDDDSWATEYNLYTDVLLRLDTFPVDAYYMQTHYYPPVRGESGVPLDSRVDWAKTDWMLFAAATAMAPGVDNETVRDTFVNDVHALMTNGQNSVPFSDAYYVEITKGDVAGNFQVYRARPVVGGHFASMALNGPNQIQGDRVARGGESDDAS